MPTFPAVALERLLEPSESKSKSKSKSQHIYISPALYTTPNPTPVPNSSPSSVSPSPYVLNRKGRGGAGEIPPPDLRLHGFHPKEGNGSSLKERDEEEEEACLDVPLLQDEEEEEEVIVQGNGRDSSAPKEREEEEEDEEIVEGNGGKSSAAKEREEEEEDEEEGGLDEFGDPCDSMSVASSCCGSTADTASSKHRLLSIQTEFYDAPDDFLSDGSTSLSSKSFSSNVESELRAARLNLSEEIERRKKAEEALLLMRSQWERIVNCLSQVGLSFPMTSETGNTLLEIESVEQFCQEIIITRFVSEAIGRGQARAEIEADAEAIIDSKNQEIGRLQDKLQYCEAVNREMSQRNQEIMEMSRKQRQSRLRRKKWIWSCIGLSVTLGASVLACSYLLDTGEQAVTSNDDSDAF